ncbi:MAG: hypothetical protein ACFFDN_00170 [Candidatus Hodarchaeota archaeon]
MGHNENREIILSDNQKTFFISKTMSDFLQDLNLDTQEIKEDFQKFLANKFLPWIDEKFIEENSIKNMFLLLTELITQFSMKLSKNEENMIILNEDEKLTEEEASNKVREILKLLDGKFTIEDAIAENIEENSRDYNDIKDQIETAKRIVMILYNRTYSRILNKKNAQEQLDNLHHKDIDIIRAIGDAGGENTLSASNTQIADALSEIREQKNYYQNIIEHPDFQPKRDPFARNPKKKNKKEGN